MNTPLKLRKINLVLLILFTILQSNCKKEKKIEFPSTVTDIDGNIYHTVLINEQVWMVENLKTIHFQNGDSIPNVVDDTLWSKLTTPAYCDFSNNSALSQVSGRLYNHSVTVDSRKICPPGWHIPNSNEWGLLSGFLGGGNFAGGKMKETGTAHWRIPNFNATNESGFTAVSSGMRNSSGHFQQYGTSANWHVYNPYTEKVACRLIYNDSESLNVTGWNEGVGFSIRCIMD
jgi:uncharacterized protein (TIGR02145 family)